MSFIEPCLLSAADKPPSGANRIHEIKHDGYRLMARRDPVGIRLITRRGHDWAQRYPLVVEAVSHLKVRSCLIEGEVACCDERGWPVQTTRHGRSEPQAFLYALDLLELNGDDLRREPIEVRKATLASILRKARHGVRLNEHLEHCCGLNVFQHACKMGREGIVSKRLGSRYRSGRSPDWLKFKNPAAPAVKREAEEDWVADFATPRACKAASHRRPGWRSPAFASSMIFLATASRVGLIPSVRSRTTRAISKAMPMRRTVSASNLWPSK